MDYKLNIPEEINIQGLFGNYDANIKLIDNGEKLFVDFPKSQRRESGVVSPDVIPLTKRVRGYIEREIIREYFKRKRGTKIQ